MKAAISVLSLLAVLAMVTIFTRRDVSMVEPQVAPSRDLKLPVPSSAPARQRANPQDAGLPPALPPPPTPELPPVPSAQKLTEGPAAPKAVTRKAATRPAVPRQGKPPIQDHIARELLPFVGADLIAEAYWIEAINDPELHPTERKDLIEDLNEEGFPDPKNPTLEDLPLIFSRLALIEQIAPDALDEVNVEAFLEAYKDLLNLADLALGTGKPVR